MATRAAKKARTAEPERLREVLPAEILTQILALTTPAAMRAAATTSPSMYVAARTAVIATLRARYAAAVDAFRTWDARLPMSVEGVAALDAFAQVGHPHPRLSRAWLANHAMPAGESQRPASERMGQAAWDRMVGLPARVDDFGHWMAHGKYDWPANGNMATLKAHHIPEAPACSFAQLWAAFELLNPPWEGANAGEPSSRFEPSLLIFEVLAHWCAANWAECAVFVYDGMDGYMGGQALTQPPAHDWRPDMLVSVLLHGKFQRHATPWDFLGFQNYPARDKFSVEVELCHFFWFGKNCTKHTQVRMDKVFATYGTTERTLRVLVAAAMVYANTGAKNFLYAQWTGPGNDAPAAWFLALADL